LIDFYVIYYYVKSKLLGFLQLSFVCSFHTKIYFSFSIFFDKEKMEVCVLARYLEDSYGEERGRYASNRDFRFWLQKTLYYIQEFLLITQQKKIFSTKFVAWEKRLVILELYAKLKKTTPPAKSEIDNYYLINYLIFFIYNNINLKFKNKKKN
jgi:hypothetical protein